MIQVQLIFVGFRVEDMNRRITMRKPSECLHRLDTRTSSMAHSNEQYAICFSMSAPHKSKLTDK